MANVGPSIVRLWSYQKLSKMQDVIIWVVEIK